jgi:hypothetical protein
MFIISIIKNQSSDIFIQIFRWTVCNPVHTASTPKQETFLAGLQIRPDKNPLDKTVAFELGALWADFNIRFDITIKKMGFILLSRRDCVL